MHFRVGIIHTEWYFKSRWHRARLFIRGGISRLGDTEQDYLHRVVFQQSMTQSEIIHTEWYFKSRWHRASSRWHRKRSFTSDGISKGEGATETIRTRWYVKSRWHRGRSFTLDGISTIGDTEGDHSPWMVFQQSVTQKEIIHPGWYFNSRWHGARSFALENKTKAKRAAYEFVTGWLKHEIVTSVACSVRALDPTGWKPVSNFKHRFKPTSLFQGRRVPEREAWNDGPFFRSGFRVVDLFFFFLSRWYD